MPARFPSSNFPSGSFFSLLFLESSGFSLLLPYGDRFRFIVVGKIRNRCGYKVVRRARKINRVRVLPPPSPLSLSLCPRPSPLPPSLRAEQDNSTTVYCIDGRSRPKRCVRIGTCQIFFTRQHAFRNALSYRNYETCAVCRGSTFFFPFLSFPTKGR